MEYTRHSVDPLVRCHAAAEGPGRPEGHPEGHDRHGSRRKHRDAHAGSREGHREARSACGRRSGSDNLGRALQSQGQHLPAADRHELRGGRLTHVVQSRDPVGRADRQANLRVEERSGDHVSPGEEARPGRPDVQEHQGREQSALCGRSPARDQPRRMVHRLLRPVAGAAEGAYEEPGQIRYGHAARAERRARDRRRLLRPALAVLGHPRTEASRNAAALQYQFVHHGRRRHLPRPFRRGTRGKDAGRLLGQAQPPGRGILFQGFRDQGRLSGVHLWRPEETRMGRRSHAKRRRPRSKRSAAPIRMPCPGRSIFPAASSAWR